jgi:MinD-like ATPase involved in chromosome partitioning or flagellar assembly
LHFNILEPEKTLHHVLDRKANVSEAVYFLEENIDLMPASFFYQDLVNPLRLKEHLKLLKRRYDFIIIDSSPALNDETLAVMLASDEILVVSTPDHVTLGTTIKAVNKARQRGAPITGVILNKVHKENFELSLNDVEEVLQVPVMAVVDHSLQVLRSLSKFDSIVRAKPHSSISKEFKRLAATISGEKFKSFRLRDIFSLVPKREDINREIYYERFFR